jgi:hypothetical protein
MSRKDLTYSPAENTLTETSLLFTELYVWGFGIPSVRQVIDNADVILCAKAPEPPPFSRPTRRGWHSNCTTLCQRNFDQPPMRTWERLF